MSKEIKSVRVRRKYGDGDVKFTLYDEIGSKYSVRATPIDTSVLGAKFEYTKRDIWKDFTDDQFISDAIVQFARIILGEVGGKEDPTQYYEIIQDPWSDISPNFRNFGYDSYSLNNDSKVYIDWSVNSIKTGGRVWSDDNGNELKIERGSTQSSKESINKSVRVEGKKSNGQLEVFTIDKNNEFSSNMDFKIYSGTTDDLDIIDDIIKKWKLKVPNYSGLDLIKGNPNSNQILLGPNYISPLGDLPETNVLPDKPIGANDISESSSTKIKLNVSFPKEFVVNAREDAPIFKIYVGDVPDDVNIDGFITESSDEELLSDEYIEGDYKGAEESNEVITFLNDALGDIPADTPPDLKVYEDNIDFNNASFVGDKWKSFDIEKAISLISNTSYKPSNSFKESLKKILYYIKNDDKIVDIREGCYMLGTAYTESGYSLQRWEADYLYKGQGIPYGPSGPPKSALNYYRSSKGKKDYYTLGVDNKGLPYFGRGMIQLTGKANYEKYGKLIGVNLISNGDLALDPQNSYKIASIYLKGRTFKHVTSGNLTKARKSVNGGTKDIDKVNGAYKEWLNILQSLSK